ncbi:MAG: glycosyltransferase family 39 protein, partial [Vicinamibacterales bacterium]
ETGNYSDESAHFMNALLLRDYVTHAFGQNPLVFAEQYYLSYPKIAPLMWPPFFHGLLGLALLPGWPPHQAALVLLATAAALTAYRLSRFARLHTSRPVSMALAALFLLTPIVVDLSTAVMVDIVLIGLGLEATWWLARFSVSGETRHGLLFGLFASACCMTKGNGVAITLVPVLLMLATGRLNLLRTRGLYASAAMVAVLAGPFVYISYRLCDSMGDFTGTGATHTLTRGYDFMVFLFQELTPVPFVLAVLGGVVAVRRAWTWPPALRTIAPAALVALASAAVLFHTILPLEYYSGRYVALAVAPLFALVPLGIVFVIDVAGFPPLHRRATLAVLLVAVLSVVLMRPAVVARLPLGFGQIVETLGAPGLAGQRILVISDESGEGAMVTETAIRQPLPVPTIVRGSKLLADGDWMNNNFQTLFGSTAETLKQIEDLHIDLLVVDRSPESQEMTYWSHIQSVVAQAGDRLVPIQATHVDKGSGPTRPITVYRVARHSPGPPAKLRINLRYSLGKVLEK